VTVPRSPARAEAETKGNPEELLIAWLMRLARLCAQLMLDGKLGVVNSWPNHASV